jgi:hypothetical protein
MTFSEPVRLPNVTLPAGTYWFKLVDSASDRNIVQIFNADRTVLYAVIVAAIEGVVTYLIGIVLGRIGGAGI